MTLAEPESIDPGLFLFACFVVRQLAHNADDSASASTTVTAAG